MHNLREFNGSFKGMAGECMFKLAVPAATITRYFFKQKYFTLYAKHLTKSQQQFLLDKWYSIDAVEIKMNENTKQIILYEIKTRNYYSRELGFKPKMTQQTHNIYTESRDKGFCPLIATVWLHDDWNFEIEYSDFDIKHYCIDKPKKWDSNRFSSNLPLLD